MDESLLGIWFALPARSHDRLIGMYALGLIMALSFITFSYFQEPNHYISTIGWVILVGLCLKHLTKSDLVRALRAVLIFFVAILVVWNSYRAHSARLIPETPYPLTSSSTLCKSFFSRHSGTAARGTMAD